MREVYIVNGLRSYIGLKCKGYRNIPAEQLAAEILKEIFTRYMPTGVYPNVIICGNSVAGGGNIARLASLMAGLPENVPAYTIDAQCASGLEAILSGYAGIASGLYDCVIAGGAESTSTQPIRAYSRNHPLYCEENPEYESAQFIPDESGENVMIKGADETAEKYHITAKDMESYILESHRRAAKAAESGVLNNYIFPVFGVDRDESIRVNMSQRLIQRLNPILPNGIITPASSCLKQDGAAFVMLCSENFVKKYQLSADFRLVTGVTVGGDGKRSPETLLDGISALVKKSGLLLSEIDRIDYNEAFAVMDVLYNRYYDKPSNVFGGALAYGHPYGASGGILTLHLMKAMEIYHDKFGICAIPAAGGICCAILLERIG